MANLLTNTKRALSRRSPGILMGIGIVGMVSTTVLAVKATPKAVRICEELRKDHEREEKAEPTKIEYVKAAWKCYLPSVVTGASSIACLILSGSVSSKRNAALAAAYKLSETALIEYRDKVIETVGEEQEKVIREKVMEDKVKQNPPSKNEVVIIGDGSTLFYDTISNRYFRSSVNAIRKIENEINRRMLSEMYISLNDFYSEVGLTTTRIGDEIGWNIDDGFLEIFFSGEIAQDDMTPCIALGYNINPTYDYTKLYR